MEIYEWDETKNQANIIKHRVDFNQAKIAFSDSKRIIAKDTKHSKTEERFYCIGKVGGGIITVRFTYRQNVIRIIGAGYWRQGKKLYEAENQIH